MIEPSFIYIIRYMGTLLLTFLGLYAGAALAFISPEEMKPGKKYFRILMDILLVVMLFVVLYSYKFSIILVVILCTGLAIFLYYMSEKRFVRQISYILLGIVLFAATKSEGLFVTIAGLIFIYGLPLGSTYVTKHIKKGYKTILGDLLLDYGLYIVLGLVVNLMTLYLLKQL